MERARAWHVLTAALAWTALILQFGLVVAGHGVLDEADPPTLTVRVVRYFAYFTIQSNILVAITATQLARDPARDGSWWRAVRLAAVVGITVTGVVHFFLLRPLLDLGGADYLADKLLHMTVPAAALLGWAFFGPRPRIDLRAFWAALAWPILWLVVTLVNGAWSEWYPYPFLNPAEEHGVGGVVVASSGITVFFLMLFGLARLIDRRAAPRPMTSSTA